MRLVEDNPSSLSLVEIYKQRCAKKGIEHDNPISRYYDRLATVQARGTQASHQVHIGSQAFELPPEASETAAFCSHDKCAQKSSVCTHMCLCEHCVRTCVCVHVCTCVLGVDERFRFGLVSW